jgi:hypothetical protein
MPAATYNLLIEQGATFERSLQFKSGEDLIDLTGWDARAQIRKSYSSTNVISTFTTTVSTNTVLISLSASATTAISPNFDPVRTPYIVNCYFPYAQLSGLPVGAYVWDLELFDTSGAVIRQLQGGVLVTPEVTR